MHAGPAVPATSTVVRFRLPIVFRFFGGCSNEEPSVRCDPVGWFVLYRVVRQCVRLPRWLRLRKQLRPGLLPAPLLQGQMLQSEVLQATLLQAHLLRPDLLGADLQRPGLLGSRL